MPPASAAARPSRRSVRFSSVTGVSSVAASSSPSPATAVSRTTQNSQRTGTLPPLSASSHTGRSLAAATSSAPTSEDALFTDGIEPVTLPARGYQDDGDLERLYAGGFLGDGVGDRDYGRLPRSDLAKAQFALSEWTNDCALSSQPSSPSSSVNPTSDPDCELVKQEAELVMRMGKLSPHGQAVNYLCRSSNMSVKELRSLSVKKVIGTTTLMLLFSRSPKTNTFQWLLSHSLHFRHAPAAVFALLNSLGLSMSYGSKMDALENLSKSILNEVRQAMQDPTTGKLLVYDNFDFVTLVQETTISHQTHLYHCTSGWVSEIIVPKEVEGEERAR
ncbi:hypothetical protein JCM5296_002448 [Sporobolomyces johnsonii]